MNKFDKKEYDLSFRKQALKEKKKAQFNTDLYYNEKDEIDTWLKIKKISKADFIRNAFINLKKEGLNMNEKKELIEKEIEGIIENAIKAYINQWDENNSMSIDDWYAGCKGTIRDYDGNILNYIYHRDFEELYSNFKYDLEKADETTLDKIIKYLEQEKKYTNYNDLDRDNYDLSEIEEEL